MTDNEFSEYVGKFHSTVFRLAYSYLKNKEDAEDIAQEAFLKLYSTKTVFSDEGHIKGWLIRVTANLCKDNLRSAWTRHRTELTTDIPSEEQEENGLTECIRKLKPEYSAVIFLYYYEDYSVKEIAMLLRLTQTAVTSRLSRGRKQLKEQLIKEGYYEGQDN